MLVAGLDKYEINARLKPALFACLPYLLLIAIWLPATWTLYGGLAGLLVACGATLLLAQLARKLGQSVQRRLEIKHGELPSITLLRRSDTEIDEYTKDRYYRYLIKVGIPVPNALEEIDDPTIAGIRYSAASRWLREATRDKKRFPLIAEENISFGFRRNLLGLRPIGLAVAISSVALNSCLLSTTPRTDQRLWAGLILEVGLAVDVAVWILAVTDTFVWASAKSYAERLLSACDTLSDTSKSKKAKIETTQAASAPN